MGSVPAGARVYVACAALGALACLSPLPDVRVPWGAVALLAALYAGCEQITRCPFMGHRAPRGMGTFFPVLLAGAFLLPVPAAALVAVPGALLSRVEQRPRALRRIWRAARLVLAVWAAARVHEALGGRDVLGAGETVGTVAGPDFPYALLPAGAAALVFCAVLTLLDGGILALAERVPARGAWKGLFLRSSAPVTVHGLAGLMMAVLWRSPYGSLAALLVLLPMYVSCWVFAQYHRERVAHRATIRALVQAVDIKDGYTRGHSERVGQASLLIARELGMDDERAEVLRFAGILHDVGKLGVPTRLLRKDGPLTPEERRVIELHPEYGHEIVRGISFLGEARAAVLHHHERLDGSGYPYGLAGGQIPEFARVVAVADAFDAMTSTRSYRRARPVAAALAELDRCAGAQFDPVMVAALARALGRHGWRPTVTADTCGNVPPHGPPGPLGAGRGAGETGTGRADEASADEVRVDKGLLDKWRPDKARAEADVPYGAGAEARAEAGAGSGAGAGRAARADGERARGVRPAGKRAP
ncbi:HD-GYP domain-containing protein [Streptomyces phaeolivaceus]|uniref:HD-GYP domain-containing protein n=1 Tax=Streptomyces phaeolivaceus TaxID=2653200 RepID=A0A5P8KB26_9ACTN|nr:HD-GYP domain-containing protein [Streptomyces phaeolivaceus]QFR00225.1 HD-GYP domain-containing protein [Streptomyces phaeolivaceus]